MRMPRQRRGGGGPIAPTYSKPGTRRMWAISSTLRLLYPQEHPVPLLQEAGWAPCPVWEARNFTGTRVPDRPAQSKSLHRLNYPGRK